jgi:hypothetical protein
LIFSKSLVAKVGEWILGKSSRADSQNQNISVREEPHLVTPLQSRQIREIRLDQVSSDFKKSWKEYNSRFSCHTIHLDPDWIEEHFKHDQKNVRIFFFEQSGVIAGAVPFVLSQERLICQLGEFTIAKLPMSILRLQGYTPDVPADENALDMLFGQILSSDFDAIQMNHVRPDSFFWGYLRNSPLVRRSFSFYCRRGTLPHLLIRLDGTFENYMAKFSAQTRKNRLRELKILRRRGEVQLVRVSSVSEVDEFLEAAYAVSRKARQFDRSGGWGLAARDRGRVRDELQFLAERGWLRSYLLKCGGVPCSFILGQQYGPSFYADTVGTDRAWRNHSVGTVLLLLALEDLFKEKSPRFYDFGSHVKWQQYFANESYPEASVWLFRRRAYPLLASSAYRASSAISLTTGAALDWLRLKSRVKQLLEWR